VAQLTSPVHTQRLILRAFTEGDLDDLADLYGRADVARFLYWGPRDRDESRAALQRHLDYPVEIAEKNVLTVAVVRPSDQRVVGDFMLGWASDEHRQGEVGGMLHPDVHGQGLASEVYEVLLRIAFEDYDLHRVAARCDGRNAASIRSLEKAGLRREAHFRENEFVKGEWTDEVVLAILKSEWPRGDVGASAEERRATTA